MAACSSLAHLVVFDDMKKAIHITIFNNGKILEMIWWFYLNLLSKNCFYWIYSSSKFVLFFHLSLERSHLIGCQFILKDPIFDSKYRSILPQMSCLQGKTYGLKYLLALVNKRCLWKNLKDRVYDLRLDIL